MRGIYIRLEYALDVLAHFFWSATEIEDRLSISKELDYAKQ